MSEPFDTYKRFIHRELDKIIKNEQLIKNYLQEPQHPNNIDVKSVADLSLMFPIHYPMYVEYYKEQLKLAKEKGYSVKTQDEIIDFINDLS